MKINENTFYSEHTVCSLENCAFSHKPLALHALVTALSVSKRGVRETVVMASAALRMHCRILQEDMVQAPQDMAMQLVRMFLMVPL